MFSLLCNFAFRQPSPYRLLPWIAFPGDGGRTASSGVAGVGGGGGPEEAGAGGGGVYGARVLSALAYERNTVIDADQQKGENYGSGECLGANHDGCCGNGKKGIQSSKREKDLIYIEEPIFFAVSKRGIIPPPRCVCSRESGSFFEFPPSLRLQIHLLFHTGLCQPSKSDSTLKEVGCCTFLLVLSNICQRKGVSESQMVTQKGEVERGKTNSRTPLFGEGGRQ